jgi:hypothetical protein
MMTLELRTIGDVKAVQSIGPATSQDGLKAN